jgi:hypothetical protein
VGPDQHDQAVERTRAPIAKPDVLVIFEAAFTFDRTRIRTDILERLPDGGWRLAEVKSSSRVKPEHLQDLAIQAYVVSGCGIALEEIQLVHVDTSYVRGRGEIDWRCYFKREVVTPALVPGLTYDDLKVVANGTEAATVFNRVRLPANSGSGAQLTNRATGSSTWVRSSNTRRSLKGEDRMHLGNMQRRTELPAPSWRQTIRDCPLKVMDFPSGVRIWIDQ